MDPRKDASVEGEDSFEGYLGRHIRGAEPEDEIAGLERNLEHWKL